MVSTAANQAPCDTCGKMVDLDSPITVVLQEPDGSKCQTVMPEWEARDILHENGVPLPPVLCNNHERYKIVTEKTDA